MPSPRLRRSAALAGALAFVMLAATARIELPGAATAIPPAGCADPDCTGATQETARALAELASGELDEAAERVASQQGLIPAGDSCGMRHPNRLPVLPRDIRGRFAAAAMASSVEGRFAILDEIAHDLPQARWRVLLEQSEVARRAGDLKRAERLADAVLRMELPTACRADALLAKALATTAPTTELLLAAVASDPGSYHAWSRLAVALMEQLDRARADRDCDRTTARAIEAIVYLDRLAKTDGQLARLERLANTAAAGSSQARALLLAMVKERTQRRDEAMVTYAQLMSASRSTCSEQIRLVAQTRIAKLRDKTP